VQGEERFERRDKPGVDPQSGALNRRKAWVSEVDNKRLRKKEPDRGLECWPRLGDAAQGE